MFAKEQSGFINTLRRVVAIMPKMFRKFANTLFLE